MSDCNETTPILGGKPATGDGNGGGGFFSEVWAPGGAEPGTTTATFTTLGLNLLGLFEVGANGGADQSLYLPSATDSNFDPDKDIKVLVVWAPVSTIPAPNDQVYLRLVMQRQQVGHGLADLVGGTPVALQVTTGSAADLIYTTFVLSTAGEKDSLAALESFRLWLQRNDSNVLDTYNDDIYVLRVVMYQEA